MIVYIFLWEDSWYLIVSLFLMLTIIHAQYHQFLMTTCPHLSWLSVVLFIVYTQNEVTRRIFLEFLYKCLKHFVLFIFERQFVWVTNLWLIFSFVKYFNFVTLFVSGIQCCQKSENNQTIFPYKQFGLSVWMSKLFARLYAKIGLYGLIFPDMQYVPSK